MKQNKDTVQQLILSRRGFFQGTAIECRGKATSYAEFDDATDRIALHLQKAGIGPGSFAAVRMKRSELMLMAIFGVLKAGAAVMPVNADMPEERFRSLRTACGVSIVLNEEYVKAILHEQRDMPFTIADLELASEDDPAMVLATSGTTGRPKGVCQNQRSLCFLFEQFPYHLSDIGIYPARYDTVIGHIQQGYIVAYHYEYPSALLNGKKLVLLTEEEQVSIQAFCEIAEKNDRCLLAMIPSQFAIMLSDERFRATAGNITSLNFFAEPVSENLKQQIRSVFPEATTAHELYGQTEIFGIGWRSLWDKDPGMIPSPGITVKLLDEDGTECRPGEKAQICVHASTIFDRYYIDGASGPDEKESARQFDTKNIVVDGVRFVKTGDLGVITDTGRFILRGRNDRMVKFHGQRLELPEIESVLLSFPGITCAAAVLCRDNAGTPLLEAYYTCSSDSPCDSKALQRHLRKHLNAYMVPSVLAQMESLPVGSNGKIDYRTLESMVPEFRVSAPASRELSEEEMQILTAAAAVLNRPIETLSAEKSLPAQGMDSLSAVLLIARLYDQGYALTLEDFLNAPSVRELAGTLKKIYTDKTNEQPVTVSQVYQVTDMQDTWIRRHFRIVRSFRIPVGIDEATFGARAEKILNNHPALRSAFFEEGETCFTKVLGQKKAYWEYRDYRMLKPERRRSAVGAYLTGLYGFPKPESLFFPAAFRMSDDETAFVLVCDHTAIDGLSEQILLEDLITDRPDRQDAYISWLEAIHDPARLNVAKEFWQEYLKDSVPACIPAPAEGKFSDSQAKGAYNLSFTPEEADVLEQKSRTLEVSVTTMVLFAYGSAFLKLLGQESIFFECVVSGRAIPVSGLADTVGCMVNSVPVRLSVRDSIKDFMTGCLQADQYSYLPLKDIMLSAFGRETIPKMAPHIDSLLFPTREAISRAGPLYQLDYSVFPEGSFLWKADNCLRLTLHFDVKQYDPAFTDKLVQSMESLLREQIGS